MTIIFAKVFCFFSLNFPFKLDRSASWFNQWHLLVILEGLFWWAPYKNNDEGTIISHLTTSEPSWLKKEVLGTRHDVRYLPGAQTQKWHSFAVIQLNGPGLLFLVHGVKCEAAGGKQKWVISTNHRGHLFLFSIWLATAESVSWVYLNFVFLPCLPLLLDVCPPTASFSLLSPPRKARG